jgi:hypothetical protein
MLRNGNYLNFVYFITNIYACCLISRIARESQAFIGTGNKNK